MTMSRNNQLSRTLRVLHYLELNPQGLRARDILEKLKNDGISCSRETVYRDFKGLQGAGFLVESDESENALWKLDRTINVAKGVQFTPNEILALFLARETLRSLERSPIFEVIESFFVKLEKVLGPRAHKELQELSGQMRVESRPAWIGQISREILDTVHSAIAEGHVLELDYRAAGGSSAGVVTTRRVGACTLYFADAGGYLLVQDLADGVFKRFALTRIVRAVMLAEPYDNHEVKSEEYFADGIGIFSAGAVEDIELFVEEPMASHLSDRIVHTSQRVVRTPTGVTITLQVRNNDELARWVLGLGPSASVVKPTALRVRVSELAGEIIEKNKKKSA